MFSVANFPKAKKFWYQGRFYDWDQALFHTTTHAFHYGTCVFEGIRAYPTDKGTAVFRLKEHVDRLFFSADVIRMKPPYTKEEVTQAIKDTVRENDLDSCYIRPLVFYSYGNLGLIPKSCPVELTITAWEWAAYLGESAAKGAHCYIVPWRRVHHTQFQNGAKLGGLYIQSTICGLEAREHGANEAVFLNMEGRVSEGPGENIFIVKNNVVKTNSGQESILEGITRSSLIQLSKDLGYKVEVGPIAKEELLNADEAFFCGTAVEITPIARITDGSVKGKAGEPVTLGSGEPGKVTMALATAYRETCAGKNPKHLDWLAYVNK